MEQWFYDLRPFVFLALGLGAAIKGGDSKLMTSSGWMLVGCSVTVVYMRLAYRKK